MIKLGLGFDGDDEAAAEVNNIFNPHAVGFFKWWNLNIKILLSNSIFKLFILQGEEEMPELENDEGDDDSSRMEEVD